MKFSKEDIQKIGNALGAETYDFGNKYIFRISNAVEKRRLQWEKNGLANQERCDCHRLYQ